MAGQEVSNEIIILSESEFSLTRVISNSHQTDRNVFWNGTSGSCNLSTFGLTFEPFIGRPLSGFLLLILQETVGLIPSRNLPMNATLSTLLILFSLVNLHLIYVQQSFWWSGCTYNNISLNIYVAKGIHKFQKTHFQYEETLKKVN